MRHGLRLGSVVMGMAMLAGCGAQMMWVKEGATQQQFNADQFDCKQKAYTMAGGSSYQNVGAVVVDVPVFFRECMQAKGYSWQQASTTPQQDGWDWLQEHLGHKDAVWLRADMGNGLVLALRDYEECRGELQDKTAASCMRTRGYSLVHPAKPKFQTLQHPQGYVAERWIEDRIACDATTRSAILVCLNEKGWVEAGPVATATHSAKGD